MVVDPEVLLSEVDGLESRGHKAVASRLTLSERAHLILPYHRVVDELRESSATEGRTIGTTKKGIGPAYEDKVKRVGIRAGDLRDLDRAGELIQGAMASWAPVVDALGGQMPSHESIMAQLTEIAPRVVAMLGDTSELVDDAISGAQHVLFEGAQGTLLDIDHGTYPFVTSSSPVAAGAAAGSGVGPNRIQTVIGIVKAYTTRVGGGPFPTELTDDVGAHLAKVGAEFGSVTGRARRTGWLDLPALRYAARVNGLGGWALTKLDVLTGLPELKVCVAYETDRGRTDSFPIDLVERGARCEPVYETLPGWTEALTDVRVLDDLPERARRYIRFLEDATGVPIYLVSVGPRRRETIVLHNPFVGRAAAP